MPLCFHISEKRLQVGETISPGRWGAIVLGKGAQHPFYFREHLLEIWRQRFTNVGISRLRCAYAHETLEQARGYRLEHEFMYRVTPIDPAVQGVRLDMLWLTWMGEAGSTPEKIASWCTNYWAGKATSDLTPRAIPSWEWLFPCALRVEERILDRT